VVDREHVVWKIRKANCEGMPVKILNIVRSFPPGVGGISNQVMGISGRLARNGHEIEVYTSDLLMDVPPFQRLPPKWLDSTTYGVTRYMTIPLPWRHYAEPFASNMLLALTERVLPDIIHCHGLNLFTFSVYPIARLKSRNCKLICTTYVDPRTISGFFIPRMLRKFDGIIALTDIEFAWLKTLGLHESKLRLIPVGVDVDAFRNLPNREQFRAKMDIHGKIVLYAGRVDAVAKGCAVLIEAVSLAQRAVGRCTVVFAGPDWRSEVYLRVISKQLGVHVIFTGLLNSADLRSALVACDVFVLPSLSEGMPLSILEAMLSGAPVVATGVGGVPTIVLNEETGLLVSVGDVQELANAICRILKDRELSTRLAGNGKRFAAQYSIDRTASKLENFYKEIMQN
jgi:glycosyltransferase involved in cell wall biosynthesis